MARSRKKAPAKPAPELDSNDERRQPAVEPASARPRTGTRVDPAHALARPPEEEAPARKPEPAAIAASDEAQPAAPPSTWPAESPADIIQQVRTHAEQLAAYLRADQKSLDHREAQLNAREAELEASTRAARLWLTEQQSELAQRAEAVLARESELEANAADVARRLGELRQTEEELEGRSSQLAAAQFVHEQLDGRPGRGSSPSGGRKQPAAQADEILRELESEVQTQRDQLAEQQRQLDRRMVAEQNALAATRRAAEAEIAETRGSLDRRAAHLDQRQAALDQFRAEVTRVHRETLEMRVLIEETWSELCRSALPPKRAGSLADARKRLTERWKLEREELAARKLTLDGIAARLTQQQEKLAEQKREFQQWLTARQSELERHAARLISREEDVRRQQGLVDDAQEQWQAERRKLKQEIRRLLLEIQRHERTSV